MNLLLKIIKWISISAIGLIGCWLIAFFLPPIFYEHEMNQIKNELSNIENVQVVNIWGHQDITLEEISARLRIKGKGEIVLYGLSSDVFNYPEKVPITEIEGYSFTEFSCDGGIGSSIDIGTNSELGKLIGIKFNSVKDIVDNYDLIINVIKGLKTSPEINHFETKNSESYLLVETKNSTDKDPIFNLLGIENKFEFAKTLKWNRSECSYNKEK